MNKEDKILKLLENMSKDMDFMKKDMDFIKEDIVELKSKVDETYQISTSLLERTDMQSSTIENIKHTLIKTQGKVVDIQKQLVDINNKTDLALDNAARNRIDIGNIKKTI